MNPELTLREPGSTPADRGPGGGTRPYLSIRLRLTVVFALFFLLVLGLGTFGTRKLSEVNAVSAEIRNHWLQATRLLGDLSNFMSDFRSAEGTHLLSVTATELRASDREAAELRSTVARVQRSYESLSRGLPESAMYRTFDRQWAAYLQIAARVLELSRAGQKQAAVALYMSESRQAFDAASATLTQLTDQTVRGAQEATERAAVTYARARELNLLAMLLATLLLFAAIGYITRSLTVPLLDLAERMRALAAHDTNIDIPGTRRQDELGGIARSVTVFRDNAVALMKTQNQLVGQAAALEAALDHERRVTVEQRNFVSMTSHEFRTPLTIIDGHAQRLLKTRERASADEIEQRATRIRGAVARMTSIMDGLLGASRLLDGTGAYHPQPFALGPVVHDVCQMHREIAPHVTIRESLDLLPETIDGDAVLVFHAINNLVANAVKYSRSGSTIVVGVRADDVDAVVEVRDQGIGIPRDEHSRIFERYFRGKNATAISGTGVGLHLVALVARLHGGSVTVRSTEGQGATFTLTLPLHSPA